MRRSLVTLALVLLFVPSAFATPITFVATLSGANEIPAVPTTATGFAQVTIDPALHTMLLNIVFSGLTSNTTAAHIHCCAVQPGNAGVATTLPAFPFFPLGVMSGTYSSPVLDTLSASTYNPAFVTNVAGGSIVVAESLLLNGIINGQTYLNIHTVSNGGGEIRGVLAPVPEPTSLLLLATGVSAAVARRRLRRRV